MCIEAAKTFQPITDSDVLKLREVSKDCVSLFRGREQQVAMGRMPAEPFGLDNPHECFRMHNRHHDIG